MRAYRPDLINMVVEKLSPHHVRIGFLSKRFEGKTTLVEPWYSSHYNTHKIEPTLIEAWTNAQPIPELSLPQRNDFIPTDFTILPQGGEDEGVDGAGGGSKDRTRPVLIKVSLA